jgi:hypothetical protein
MTNTFYCKKNLPVVLTSSASSEKRSESPHDRMKQTESPVSQADFITHLLATKMSVPQLRLRRRESSCIAAQVYAAVRDVATLSRPATASRFL